MKIFVQFNDTITMRLFFTKCLESRLLASNIKFESLVIEFHDLFISSVERFFKHSFNSSDSLEEHPSLYNINSELSFVRWTLTAHGASPVPLRSIRFWNNPKIIQQTLFQFVAHLGQWSLGQKWRYCIHELYQLGQRSKVTGIIILWITHIYEGFD